MHSFRNNNYNSKSAQCLEYGHPMETTDNSMKILHMTTKGAHLDTMEKF